MARYNRIKVVDVMTKTPLVMTPAETIGQADELMTENRIRQLPVVRLNLKLQSAHRPTLAVRNHRSTTAIQGASNLNFQIPDIRDFMFNVAFEYFTQLLQQARVIKIQ